MTMTLQCGGSIRGRRNISYLMHACSLRRNLAQRSSLYVQLHTREVPHELLAR